MIDHKNKFIFVHIPKCAGTSIYKSLIPQQDWYDINNTEHGGWDAERKIYKQHATALQIKKFYCANFNDYFSFTFTRNPWSKLVSDYFWTNTVDVIPNGSKGKGSFLEYLKKETFYRNDHILPQVDFILDDKGNNMIDFVGRFENIQEDFNTVCDKIEIPRQILSHKNATKHKHYTEYYDDETRHIVAESYAKDIEYFGYKFEE